MREKLLLKLNKMESDRKLLLDKITSFPIEKIYQSQSGGKWSIAQILEHVRVSEKQTLRSIQRTLQDRTEFQFATTRSDLALWILQILFKIGVKFKAPSFVSSQIAEKPDWEHLLDDWQNSRNEIKKIIESMDEYMLYKIIFKHPYVGLMTVKHVLGFQHAHFKVHQKQILKILYSKP
jgi:hypothetical protein